MVSKSVSVKYASIGLSVLERMTVREIILSQPGYSIDDFDSVMSVGENLSHYDAIIITSHELVYCLETLLPRRKSVAVLCRSMFKSPVDSGFRILSDEMTEEDVIDVILKIGDSKKHLSERPGLSKRERDVLIQISSGLTNKEIASVLKISVNTVITHRKNISEKLGIRSASGLSLYAAMNGLI